MHRKLKRIVVKEELVALTGDFIKAMILNQFLYWTERVDDFDRLLLEEKEKHKFSQDTSKGELEIELRCGWIYKKVQELSEELMVNIKRETLRKYIKSLIDNGWLYERRNPIHKWDNTLQYRVDRLKVQKDLRDLGYHLEGFELLNPNENIGKPEIGLSNVENRDIRCPKSDIRQSEIGLSLTETTTKINKEKNIKKRKKDLMNQFDEFWSAYPNKKAKPKAMIAFEKAMKKTDLETILEALKTYREKTDPEFYSHPATWLNQERWEDDYKSPGSSEPIELKDIKRQGIDKTICDLLRENVSDGFYKSYIEPSRFVSESNQGGIKMQTRFSITYDKVSELFSDFLQNNGFMLIGWEKIT